MLTYQFLYTLIARYPYITCLSFMDVYADLPMLCSFADYVRTNYQLHTAWYTGLNWEQIPNELRHAFDFIKVGPYIKALGALKDKHTNQRFYRIDRATGTVQADLTYRFQGENRQT